MNGWRFWSVQGRGPKAREGGEKSETQAAKAGGLIYRVLNQKGIAEGQSRWFCWVCMRGLGAEGGGQPEGGLPGRPPWRAGADHDGAHGEGSERVGADGARDEASSHRRDAISSCARR